MNREGCTVGLGMFRLVVGLMAIRHLAGYLRDWAVDGFYGNFFFLPYAPWIPQPNEAVYLFVLAIGLASATGLALGIYFRVSAITCFLAVTYHLSLNEVWYRHNRYFLVLCLFLLCFSPAGTAFGLDAVRKKLTPVGPLWSSWLIKCQMTLIYLASATSKSLDPAWRDGAVLEGRGLDDFWYQITPRFIWSYIDGPLGARLMTISALLTEFFLAIFLWFPRTRRFAIIIGVLFHGFIEVRYSVLTFSYLSMATYFVFAEPQPKQAPSSFPEKYVLAFVLLYLAFVVVTNTIQPLLLPHDWIRFADLPWFAGIFLLMFITSRPICRSSPT